MPSTGTPIAPTIDDAAAQIQHEIDHAADEVAAAEGAIANHIQALPDSYAQLAKDLAAKGANADQLVKAHAEYVAKHPATLKALQEALKAAKANKQALERQKQALLSQQDDPLV